MKTVTREEFWEYFKDKEFTKKPGSIFHSDDFTINNEVVGRIETSSWCTLTSYTLKYATSNSETVSIIKSIIKSAE